VVKGRPRDGATKKGRGEWKRKVGFKMKGKTGSLRLKAVIRKISLLVPLARRRYRGLRKKKKRSNQWGVRKKGCGGGRSTPKAKIGRRGLNKVRLGAVSRTQHLKPRGIPAPKKVSS